MRILKRSAFVWEVARRLLLVQKALLFGRLVKVSSQTCRQTTCKYQRYNLPKVFPKLTSSDTNALRADFLNGLGWTFPLGFRISRNIEQNFNLHFFFNFFVQTTKNPVGHLALLLSAACMVVLWLKVQEHLLVISLMLISLPLVYFVVHFCSGSVDLLEPFGLLLIWATLV